MRLRSIRPWLIENLPTGLLARPAEWFLAVLCFLSGVTILTGVSHSESAARVLPQGIYVAWGACLVIGGAGLSCGLSSYRRTPGGWKVTRVPCYRLGLRLLGASSGAYSACLIVTAGWAATLPASIATAFCAMCIIRLLTLVDIA